MTAETGRTPAALLRAARRDLTEAGIDDADGAAKALFLHAAGWTPADLILHADEGVAPQIIEQFQSYMARRLAREPVSAILGRTEFMGLEFRADSRALAPRADSERLVEAALGVIEDRERGALVDLGTGSGCLLISILAMKSGWTGTGLDKSAAALSLARENAEALLVSERVTWIEGDWQDAAAAIATADLVISNPPYIRSDVVTGLDPEVRNHDPMLALDGGADGLSAYRYILTLLDTHARPGAHILFEIGYDQAGALDKLVEQYDDFIRFTVLKDFSGHDRVVQFMKA